MIFRYKSAVLALLLTPFPQLWEFQTQPIATGRSYSESEEHSQHSAPATLTELTLTPAEHALLLLTNETRAEHHLPPLLPDSALTRAARLHAAWVLGDPGPLEHQYAGEPDLIRRAADAGARFETVAENLARNGRSAAELHQTWMRTPVHRANILDPRLTSIGIGVVAFGGLLFAVEDFARSVPASTDMEVEGRVATLLHAAGFNTAAPSAAARLVCQRNDTTSPGATLVVQWETSDLHMLPDVLQQQATHSRPAAIGTCAPHNPQNRGFTTFRVAVLLY